MTALSAGTFVSGVAAGTVAAAAAVASETGGTGATGSVTGTAAGSATATGSWRRARRGKGAAAFEYFSPDDDATTIASTSAEGRRRETESSSANVSARPLRGRPRRPRGAIVRKEERATAHPNESFFVVESLGSNFGFNSGVSNLFSFFPLVRFFLFSLQTHTLFSFFTTGSRTRSP